MESEDNNIDDCVDAEIRTCLNLDDPTSFFLFAGAGSGKTGSLVKALKHISADSGERLRLYNQKVGVITYTNSACDEIKTRLKFDPLIEVSTIHSFVWSLIDGFHTDIREWLRKNLIDEIGTLNAEQVKGRAGTKTAKDREKSISKKQQRLANLDQVRIFTYNPNGENLGRDSLNHAEVIKIGVYFLTNKPLMQRILANKFPILLIDESQDTNKHLMEAMLSVQEKQSHCFCLGLLGDTMQRIYSDGKIDLGINLPKSWKTPVKRMNHRCPHRGIRLINKIRSAVDTQTQRGRTDKPEGFVRLFVLPNDTPNKQAAESAVTQRMGELTNDLSWFGDAKKVKTLILEHHMAAGRMGFLEMFKPLYGVDKLKTGLLNGTLSGLRLFSEQLLPLIEAKQQGNEFAAAAIVRKFSPLLHPFNLAQLGGKQPEGLQKVREAVEALMMLWSNNAKPRFLDVLRCVNQSGLFEIPHGLYPIASRSVTEQQNAENDIPTPQSEDRNIELDAWDQFMQTPFEQIKPYADYINGVADFGTHQGVKGLEFPRVMVVMDDEEAGGFLFSYEKLFGVKDKTKTDLKNEQDGNETGIDRTRRLFYVTCSRAEKSLAIVAYSANPQKVRDHVIREGWFDEHEVELFT